MFLLEVFLGNLLDDHGRDGAVLVRAQLGELGTIAAPARGMTAAAVATAARASAPERLSVSVGAVALTGVEVDKTCVLGIVF